MNKMEIGKKVFSIHHSDGKAHPSHYWLEYEGNVVDIKATAAIKRIEWKKPEGNGVGNAQYGNMEALFLAPSIDGFCYYMAELPEMEQYKDGDMYKVPTQVLKTHMKSYQSPWS